jgi:hypothetical protein
MLGPLRSSASLLTVMPLQPMDMLALDLMGPTAPVTSRQERYVLAIVDYFSRYCWPPPEATVRSLTVLRNMRPCRDLWTAESSIHRQRFAICWWSFPTRTQEPGSCAIDLVTIQPTVGELGREKRATNSRGMKVNGYSPTELMLGFSPRVSPEEQSPDNNLWIESPGRET